MKKGKKERKKLDAVNRLIARIRMELIAGSLPFDDFLKDCRKETVNFLSVVLGCLDLWQPHHVHTEGVSGHEIIFNDTKKCPRESDILLAKALKKMAKSKSKALTEEVVEIWRCYFASSLEEAWSMQGIFLLRCIYELGLMDEDFHRGFKMKLISGRSFSDALSYDRERYEDSSRKINEELKGHLKEIDFLPC